MTKPIRCRFGRHRWVSVGKSENGIVSWECRSCGKIRDGAGLPPFKGASFS